MGVRQAAPESANVITKLFAIGLLASTCFASGAAVCAPASDPVEALRHARSLRCTYQSSSGTWVRNGHRTIEADPDNGVATYDDIDLARGTARIIANAGAADLKAWIDRQGTLWLIERTPMGYEVVTTVYPMYAEGSSDEFVVLESRHSFTGPIAVASTAYGTCKIWQ